jgi:hypothetical protein
VLLSLFLALATIKNRKHSNQPKPITHSIQSHPSTQREKQVKKPPSRERKLLCACLVAVLVTWMSFASGGRELRVGVLSMLETHIVMSSLIFRLVLILTFCLAFTLVLLLALSHVLPHTSSSASPQFTHGSNHRSYSFGPRENRFESRCFGYAPRPHRGDHFLRRSGFPAGGSFTHFESRHSDGSRFLHRGLRPTQPTGEVQKTVKTFSGLMVKCWISKIYLTNPSTEPSTPSRPV